MKVTVVTLGQNFVYRKVISWSVTTNNDKDSTFVFNTKKGTKRLYIAQSNVLYVRED